MLKLLYSTFAFDLPYKMDKDTMMVIVSPNKPRRYRSPEEQSDLETMARHLTANGFYVFVKELK